MTSLAGTTLVWPGSALDRIWNLNPRAHEELAPFGRVVGIPFLLLGATLAVASLEQYWGAIKALAARLLAKNWEPLRALGSGSTCSQENESTAKYVIGQEVIGMLAQHEIAARF